jgi:hypothetical protein
MRDIFLGKSFGQWLNIKKWKQMQKYEISRLGDKFYSEFQYRTTMEI